MARVSRMAAARGGSSSVLEARRAASVAEQGVKNVDLYPSINSLRSEQDDTDFSCLDYCKTG